MEAKKSKKAAIENQRGSWLLMGLVVALAFMFVSFETINGHGCLMGIVKGGSPWIFIHFSKTFGNDSSRFLDESFCR